MLSQCTTESLCRRQRRSVIHSRIIVSLAIGIAVHVVLDLAVHSSEADLVIHCQATLAPLVIQVRVLVFLVYWMS